MLAIALPRVLNFFSLIISLKSKTRTRKKIDFTCIYSIAINEIIKYIQCFVFSFNKSIT